MRLAVFIIILFIQNLVIGQNRYDVIIDEVMADPSPQVGLPNAEYLELKNISAVPYNLNGWMVYNDAQVCRITTDVILLPDSFIVLCSSSAVSLFNGYGSSVSLSNFNALNNEAATLSLVSRTGNVIHAVRYNKSWYANAVKSGGGWSLEMIDTRYPCYGEGNWKASQNETGGSPGRKNSVARPNIDTSPPRLQHIYAKDSTTLLLTFDDPLDSNSAIIRDNYILAQNTRPLTVVLMGALFNQVMLAFDRRFIENEIMHLSIQGVKDCSGNALTSLSVTTGLPVTAATRDVIINEVLFNPKPGGADYLELFNRSKKILDLKSLYLSSRTAGGQLLPAMKVSDVNRILLPGGYCLLTEEADLIKREYTVMDMSTITGVQTLPSMPDDSGSVVILNVVGEMVDELKYYDNWHFKLLNNKEGVSLERISAEAPTQTSMNWHSAAASGGAGTPGYKNSQAYQGAVMEENINIDPPAFSPDNNGTDDYTNILYRFPAPGYVVNITVFTIAGAPVRYLARNILCGTSGSIKWDGLDERGNRLSEGVYILLIDCFTLDGKRIRCKKTVTLAPG